MNSVGVAFDVIFLIFHGEKDIHKEKFILYNRLRLFLNVNYIKLKIFCNRYSRIYYNKKFNLRPVINQKVKKMQSKE